MSNIFNSEQSFRISKKSPLNSGFTDEFLQENKFQSKSNKLILLLEKTCYLVESLQKDNRLLQIECLNLKQMFFSLQNQNFIEKTTLQNEIQLLQRKIVEERQILQNMFDQKLKDLKEEIIKQPIIKNYFPPKKPLNFKKSETIFDKKPLKNEYNDKKSLDINNDNIFLETKGKKNDNEEYNSIFSNNRPNEKCEKLNGESLKNLKYEEITDKSNEINEVEENEILVYITRTGAKYHRKTCGYLHSSCIEISLKKALISYSPCSRCCPP